MGWLLGFFVMFEFVSLYFNKIEGFILIGGISCFINDVYNIFGWE